MANIDLKVPYEKKDAAKALGAWWSQERKCWFVPSGVLLAPFAEWLPAGEWLAKRDKTTVKSAKRKDGRAAKKGAARADGAGGKTIVGASYTPQEGDGGLPWNV